MNVNKKYKIGLSFGAYCPLHYGHINLFYNAKKLCEILIVCISTDSYIKKHKHYNPPVSWNERKFHVESIKWVDKVDRQSLIFGKKEAVAKHRPDVLLVGDDWNSETYSGMNLGVPVEFLPYTKGISSTMLRENNINLQLSSLK